MNEAGQQDASRIEVTKLKLTLPGFDFIALNLSKVTRNVVDIGLTLLVVPNLAPKRSWLFEID